MAIFRLYRVRQSKILAQYQYDFQIFIQDKIINNDNYCKNYNVIITNTTHLVLSLRLIFYTNRRYKTDEYTLHTSTTIRALSIMVWVPPVLSCEWVQQGHKVTIVASNISHVI